MMFSYWCSTLCTHYERDIHFVQVVCTIAYCTRMIVIRNYGDEYRRPVWEELIGVAGDSWGPAVAIEHDLSDYQPGECILLLGSQIGCKLCGIFQPIHSTLGQIYAANMVPSNKFQIWFLYISRRYGIYGRNTDHKRNVKTMSLT